MHGDQDWDDKKQAEGDEDAALYNMSKAGAGLSPVDAQYQSAIKQVVQNMKRKTAVLGDDAVKIAKAVTKVRQPMLKSARR